MIENPPSNAEALGWIPGQGTTIPCASEQLSPSASHNKNPVQPKKKKKTAMEKNIPGGSVAKNPPAMQEMQVQCWGWENALEKGLASHCSVLFLLFTPVFLPGEFHGQRNLVATVPGVSKSRTQLNNTHTHTHTHPTHTHTHTPHTHTHTPHTPPHTTHTPHTPHTRTHPAHTPETLCCTAKSNIIINYISIK